MMIMKKALYILAAVLLTLSCNKLENFEPEHTTGRPIENGMLLVDFKVNDASFGHSTKAMGMQPHINNLKVVVFDQNGMFLSQSEATLSNKVESDNKATGTYQAYFPINDNEDEARIVHFIANYNQKIEFGTELEVVSKLITTGNADAYWQRIELPYITAEGTADDMHLAPAIQEILRNGGKRDSELAPENRNKGVTLIRNFCAFTITSDPDVSHLKITGAAIYNVPNMGTVAPYSSDNSSFVGGNHFVTQYENYTLPENLIADGYKASIPHDPGLSLKEFHEASFNASTDITAGDGSVVLFSYERETPLADAPYILLRGKFGADEATRDSAIDTWYKINLRDVNDQYYPLLRNFNYQINIGLVKQEGSASAADAAKSPGSGDISTDVRFSQLTNISNGEARMSVSPSTEIMMVSTDPVYIKYQFIDETQKPPVIDNVTNVTVTLGEPGLTGKVFNETTGVVDVANSTIIQRSASDVNDYRTLKFTPVEPEEFPKTQSVTITGTYTDPNSGNPTTISRTIVFTLREKPVLSAKVLNSTKAETAIKAEEGTDFYLRVGIPAGLPSYVFPLILEIESNMNTISSVALPVASKESEFIEGKPTVAYLKTVNWSDYTGADINDDNHIIDIPFKTNEDISDTFIHVSNRYFVPAVTELKNPGLNATNNGITLSWVGSDRTENSQWLIKDGRTILTVRVQKSVTGVNLSINGGADVTAEKYKEDDTYAYYTYEATNITAGSDGINMDVTVKPTGSSPQNFKIQVWKAKVTIGTQLTSVEGLTQEGRDQDWHYPIGDTSKKIWAGVVFKNKADKKDRASLYMNDPGHDDQFELASWQDNDVTFCFQLSQNYLRSIRGMYLDVNTVLIIFQIQQEKSFGSAYFNPNTVQIEYKNQSSTNVGFRIMQKDSNYIFVSRDNGNGFQINAHVGVSYTEREFWQVWACTVEYVHPNNL